MNKKPIQLIIVGAGPAGLTAGFFAKRYGMDFLVFGKTEKSAIAQAHLVENYPATKPMTGPEFIKEIEKSSGIKPKQEQIEKISKTKNGFQIITNKGQYQSQTIILALGMKTRKLGIKNEETFLSKDIFYHSPNELTSIKNKTVSVIGGGDSALMSALKLSDHAKKVYLIHRRDEFRGASILVKKAEKKENIEIVYSANAIECKGKNKLETLILNNGKELKIDKLFIEVGGIPNACLYENLKIQMENNFIITDKNQTTNLPGLFAAGDITNNPLKLIVTAVSQGANATFSAYNYIKNSK
ncbi:MAG: FAD-dependent oxidoreductase [bacterium]